MKLASARVNNVYHDGDTCCFMSASRMFVSCFMPRYTLGLILEECRNLNPPHLQLFPSALSILKPNTGSNTSDGTYIGTELSIGVIGAFKMDTSLSTNGTPLSLSDSLKWMSKGLGSF